MYNETYQDMEPDYPKPYFIPKISQNMTWQTMLELSDGWDVHTPLGRGTVLIITTPSYLGNSTLYVKLEDGQLKHFDSNDVRIYGSPTYGEPLNPKIPTEWKK